MPHYAEVEGEVGEGEFAQRFNTDYRAVKLRFGWYLQRVPVEVGLGRDPAPQMPPLPVGAYRQGNYPGEDGQAYGASETHSGRARKSPDSALGEAEASNDNNAKVWWQDAPLLTFLGTVVAAILAYLGREKVPAVYRDVVRKLGRTPRDE